MYKGKFIFYLGRTQTLFREKADASRLVLWFSKILIEKCDAFVDFLQGQFALDGGEWQTLLKFLAEAAMISSGADMKNGNPNQVITGFRFPI